MSSRELELETCGALLVARLPSPAGLDEAVMLLSMLLRKVPPAIAATDSSGVPVRSLVLIQGDESEPFFGRGVNLLHVDAEMLPRWEKLLGNLREIKVVLVACVRGPFHEIGLAVMLACDFRLACSSAEYIAMHKACGVVPLCSLSFLGLHLGLRMCEQTMRYPGGLSFKDMRSLDFVKPATEDMVASAQEFDKTLGIPHSQALVLQRRLVNGFCIVERNELKGHSAACNALCVQHAARWEVRAPHRRLLPVEDAMRTCSNGAVLEVHLAAHVRDAPTSGLLAAMDQLMQRMAAAPGPRPVMAAIYLSGVPEHELEWEDVLVAGELVEKTCAADLATQERDRAVIQWFLRWERVVDFIAALPMVSVAVLQGPGSPSSEALQLAVACDLRVAEGEVTTHFPRRNTLPGVMTFQLGKHVGPTHAKQMLMTNLTKADLHNMRFLQESSLDSIRGRAAMIPRPLLLAYRSLVDCLWNYDHQTLFSMVEKHRSSLEAPVADATATSANDHTAGCQLDVKYSQGALSITIQTPLVTAQLLQDLKRELSDIAAKALYIYGHTDGCHFTLAEHSPEMHADWDAILMCLFKLKVPSIMVLHKKVNGHGLALALACSETLAVDGASLQVEDLVEGRLPSPPVLEAVRTLRMGRMHELLLLGRCLTAIEMVEWGLASTVVSQSGELVAGKSLWNAESIAAYPRLWHLRQRVREMPQSDWPKNLETVHRDKLAAGLEPSPDSGGGAMFVGKEGPITVVHINRPHKANAYNSYMLRKLTELIAHLEEVGARVVIFRSTDPRFFCSGADIERIANPSARDATQLESQRVFDQLSQSRLFTVAVVEGAAVGGGFEWALACDVRVVGPRSRMFFPETSMGLIPSAGGCTRLTALVGAARSKQIVLCGEVVDAARAVEWGIAQFAPEGDPLQFSMDVLAPKIVKRPDLAVELGKKVIDMSSGGEHQLLLERVSEAVLYQTKHRPQASIVATGTAVPPQKFTQHEVADLLGIHDKKMRGLFVASHILTRHLAEIDQEQDGISQKELLAKHLKWGISLGTKAIDQALSRAGIRREDVKFLCVASSTGFLIPPLTCHLTECMGLSPHIQRTDVVGMGCHAGLNILQVASNWALANPGLNAVMCSVEICSAEYVWNKSANAALQMKLAVTNSLFGDGCTAAVIRCDPEPRIGSIPRPLPPGRLNVQVMGFESYIIPSSLDTLYLEWDDVTNKFSFFLTSDVPYAIGEHMPLMINALLDRFGLSKKDIAHWVVHSGGKKVLDSMVYSLGITKHDVRHTVSTLRDYGNISSGAFLLAFERLQQEGTVKCGDIGMFVTMGPGAGMECSLFRVRADIVYHRA